MASLASYALTTVADVKETLGISSGVTTKDNLITRKINQATDMIENYCERRFASTAYTEEYDGSGIDELILRQRPIISFTSLEARNTVLNQSDWSTIPTDQYFLDNNAGMVKAITYFWGNYNRWRATYTAGYATIPYDLQEACATLAAYLTTNSVPGQIELEKREGSRMARYQQLQTDDLFARIGIKETLDNYADTVVSGNR